MVYLIDENVLILITNNYKYPNRENKIDEEEIIYKNTISGIRFFLSEQYEMKEMSIFNRKYEDASVHSHFFCHGSKILHRFFLFCT